MDAWTHSSKWVPFSTKIIGFGNSTNSVFRRSANLHIEQNDMIDHLQFWKSLRATDLPFVFWKLAMTTTHVLVHTGVAYIKIVLRVPTGLLKTFDVTVDICMGKSYSC